MFRKLAVALVAPLLVVAACGGADEVVAADPVAAVRAVPEAVAAAGSARFDLTVALADADGALEVTSTGAYGDDRLSLELDLGDALASVGGMLGELGESMPAGVTDPARLVVADGTAYLRVPLLDELLGTAGWLSATPADLDAVGSFGQGLGSLDPASLLEVLGELAGDVEEVGPDEVRGEPTTRYRATVDLQRFALPEGLGAALGAPLAGADLAAVPVELWLDGEGLPRRVVVDVGGAAAAAVGEAGTATLTVELYDYGQPVDIEVPDPAEVTPIGEVLGALGGLGGLG